MHTIILYVTWQSNSKYESSVTGGLKRASERKPSLRNTYIHQYFISLHMVLVSADSSEGEWMYLTVCPLDGPGPIPDCGGVFQGTSPWLITLCQPILHEPAWQKVALPPLNDTTQPVDIEKEGLCPTTLRQWLKRIWSCHFPYLEKGSSTHQELHSHISWVYSTSS